MDVNSRDPSQNILPFRIKGVEAARFDICGNLGIGTTDPTAKLEVVGTVKIDGEFIVNGRALNSLTTGVVINMDSQPAPATALNRQKKQSIPLPEASTLSTSNIIVKMSGVSVGKTQTYGVGAAQVASYGNIVVAVGSGTNSIAYSLANPPTASSWVGIPNSANTFTTQGRNIAYANGTWVAVGEGTNSIAYSTMTPPVASSWVGIPTGSLFNGVTTTFGTRGNNIAYGNGAWVAVGTGTNSIAYSLANPPTAESWVAIPLSFSPTVFNNVAVGITFGNGTWVATGYGNNVIAYSVRTPPTADSWIGVQISNQNDNGNISTFENGGVNITYANGVWMAAGVGTNTLCYSVENPPIASSWMPITTAALFGAVGLSVAYGNGVWVACGGYNNTLLAYSTARIPHSSSWVSMKGPTPSSQGEIINNISFNAATNTWYFLGDIGNNCLFYSTATPPVPATWIGVQRSAGAFTIQAFGAVGITTPAFTAPINVARLDNKVTFPVNRMLAVGGGGAEVIARSSLTPTPAMTGTISYSDDDGATWAMVPGGATNAMFSSAADISAGTSFGIGGSRGANAVAWNGEKWIAAGNGRTHSLAFSDDGGMTWNGVTGKSLFSVEARDVAWNGRMWVAVGRGINFSTAYSYDGVTWMGPVTDDVSGTPINVFSFDIAGPTAAMSDISGGGNHVIWTGKMWVATGTRTLIAGSSPPAYYTIAYSRDGKSWTGAPESGAANTGFDIYAHGMAWNGRNFIATGRGTVNTLAFSTDATSSWQGLGNTVFSIWGRGVTWGARRWMATGRGTNTVAFSTNGRNWQGCGSNVFNPIRRFMAMGDTGLYTSVSSGQSQRGVAFTYSDDGVTWDAPVVNQAVEFSLPLSNTLNTTRSVIVNNNNNTIFTNVITDNTTQHTALMYSIDAGASWIRVPGSSDALSNGGTGMTPANNGCYSIATNSTRTRFIAAGGDNASATRKVSLSNDGFNWNSVTNTTPSTSFTWVQATLWVGGGYNRWLIGGSDRTTPANGRIMVSGDDTTINAGWSATSPSTFTGTVISCFAANTDFTVILAGAHTSNTIYRSVNNGGNSWINASIASTPLGSVRSIAFSPSLGRWVAVGGSSGAANTIIYSTDATGETWIAPPLQAKTAPTAIFKNGSEVTRVIWDALGGRFLIGGWNGRAVNTLTNIVGLNDTNNNTGYTMAYSVDGVNWIPVTVRASDTANRNSQFGPFLTQCREIMVLDVSGEYTPVHSGYSVTWNPYANRFIATGNGTTPVVYSNDGGVTWTPANQQRPQEAIAVAGGIGGAAGVGTASPVTYTIDGKTWSQGIGLKEIFGTTGTVVCVKHGQTSTAISPNGRMWVVGALGETLTGRLAFSQNGIRWTAVTNSNTLIGNVRTIAYAPPTTDPLKSANSAVAISGVGNGVWVAGGNNTNSLIFSYDGISWSEVPGSTGILSQCNACEFGGGIFVAGGVAGTDDPTAILAYSTDGLIWRPIRGTISRINTTGNAVIQCITYGRDDRGRGLWVAGAMNASGTPSISLLYSYNGIDWVGRNNSASSLGTTITGIAYGVISTTGQGLWVASVSGASGYSFISSTTGRDEWTTMANTKTGLFNSGSGGATGVAYLNGVWYATGNSGGDISNGRTLAYSYDGSGGWFGVYPSSNMYGQGLTTFGFTTMNCVATTNDYVTPVAAMTPIRNTGWTAGVGSVYLQHPTLLFGKTVATTGAATATATAISGDGGRSWGGSLVGLGNSAFRGGSCNDAFWNGTVWVAVGYDAVTGSKVATSIDGITWTQLPGDAIPISGTLYTIMWNGEVWMVGGDGSPTNDENTASIAWSTNLTTWTAVTNTDTKLYIVKRIAWNGMYWVAVGLGTVSTIAHSRDRNGQVWEDTNISSPETNKTGTITSEVNDVVWGGGRWVAVGRGNDIVNGNGVSILYSVDTPAVNQQLPDYAITGRRWTGVAASARLFPYGATSISWNGKRFVATGPAYSSSKSGTAGNIIAWSVDGISWTAYSTTKTVAPGQRWVAVGSGSTATIATSGDGRTWTDVSGSALLFSDISGANTAVVNTMLTGARAIGWNASSLVVGGARSATTATESSQSTATANTGRTTIPVCAFIGSGNGVMGGGTTNIPDARLYSLTMRASSSVFITHLDVNMRDASAPWTNMWLNTYTDLSGTQLFQVTPESQNFSSALKWNGWSWVANFGMTTFHPLTGEQYGSIWYCTDPLARVGWSVASNSVAPRILIGQGGYAALEWNGVAWLACGYDPNNNNLIYTTDRYGATGWAAVTGIVGGGSTSYAPFQPVCIASSPRVWVVGGSQGTTSAMYYTNDRTGATGWRAILASASVLPGIRITSVGYNGIAWICCGGGGGGSGAPASSISWRADASDDIGTGWAAATISGSSGGIPSNMSTCSAVAYNAGATSTTPIWVVVGDVSGNMPNQVAYTTNSFGSLDWKIPAIGNSFTLPTFSKLNGIAWTGYSWIASCGAGLSRIGSTTDATAATSWNNTANSLFSPTLCTNAVAYVNIPISLLTTGMPTSVGAGAGTGAMWRGGVGRAQGLLPGGGGETTSVVVRSENGAEGMRWSQVYSRNFLIAVGGGVIRDASGVGGANRMAYSYDGGISWTTNNTTVLTNAANAAFGAIRTVKYGNGMWVAGGDSAGSGASGGNCLAWSRDGVNWTGAGGTQIFGSAGACYAVCCNDRGRWVAVGGAALGTAGTYTNTSGAIYTMAWSDDGMNWTPVLGSRALFGIVVQGVTYGADASGVGMWMAIGRGAGSPAYTGCAYSYDAKNWYLSQTSGSLFGTSANVLTERYAPVANLQWFSVSLSSTGQYQTAVVRGSGNIWTSSDYGVNWTDRTTGTLAQNRNWYSVSLSSTGQYQTAVVSSGNIWTSSDYGVNWVSRATSSSWHPVSLSSTGQYQTAVVSSGNIWTSSDYGVNWTERTTGTPAATRAWRFLSLSSTGQYQTAVVTNGNIWTSSDYGVNWTERTTGNPAATRNWTSVSLSSTGQYQTAVAQVTGNIWTSLNYGVNWTDRTTGTLAQNREWYSVSLSSTGQYQTAVVWGSGNIWTSSDYGVNWTERTTGATRGWMSVSLSSTGQYQTAVVDSGNIWISSNFGETWSSGATDSRSLGVAYGKDASGVGMWIATAGRRDRDVSASVANTMAYSYDGKLWRGITAAAGLSEQAWSVAYGKDGFGVGMWVCAGYDVTCGLKWSYDGITWNASMGASGAAVWVGMAAGRRALSVYWNGSMWFASTSDTRNGEPRGTGIAANNASGVPGYLLYSYNGKNWLPVLASKTYAATISTSAQPSVYSVLPNPAILDFGSFYDDPAQRGMTIANTTARTVGAVMSSVPIENVNTIVPYGRGSLTTGQVPFLLGGDSGLVDTTPGVAGVSGTGAPPPTSELAATTSSLSTSVDGGITWRAVPNSTRVMTKVNKILCDETTQQIVAVGAGNYSVATSTPAKAADADGWVGVFGSRMTDTRAGLFEKYGTGAAWFGGAKMWIASGRAQSRRGSSLAVSVNGTVWQDAKIVSQVAAGSAGAGAGRGGGLASRTTGGAATMTSSIVPYTAATTPLLTYTDSATAFSTQVGGIATNSQYNRAVVGGSSIQFVAGGRGGIAVSNDGQNWTAAAGAGASTVFQTPTNVAAYSTATGSGGFDASFGTVALTQRLTTPATYPSGIIRGVSLSKTGQYQTACQFPGNLWISTDYGVTWNERIIGESNERNWRSVSISSTGQYQTAVASVSGFIWTSSDYGATWTKITNPGAAEYIWVSLSSTGQYQSAVVWNGFIWTSSNYGVNWVGRATYQSWRSVSLSSTGQYQSAAALGTNGIWLSSDYGVSWQLRTITSSNFNWDSVSLSASGQYQTTVIDGGNIYTSTDYGVSWTIRSNSVRWFSVSLSSNGQFQTASIQFNSSLPWISSDYGVTWREITSLGANDWRGVSLSSSGQYQTIGSTASIYTSTDFGATWVQRSTATRTNAFTRIKSSASGQYQIATSGPVGNTNGQLYVSSDYGQSWIPRRGRGSWLGGAVSATGAVMMSAGPIYIVPNAFYVRIGNTNWVDFIPLLTANTTTSVQTWGSFGGLDAQFNDVNYGAVNEIAKQFSYFAGYWLNFNKAVVGQSFRVPTYGSPASGFLGIFTFTATSTNPVSTYTGSLTGYDSMTYDLTPQTESITTGSRAGINVIIRSTDFGNTFTDVPGTTLALPAYWRAISVSNSAAVQTAVAYGGSIYRSLDTGATWSNTGITIDGNAGANTATPRNWQDIAVSAETGAIQVTCVSGGYLYFSTNTGASWNSSAVSIDGIGTQTTNRVWQAVAVSADGQYGLACVNSTTAAGFLYRSTNSGATWTSTDISINGVGTQTTNRSWQDVGMSANGKYQVACVNSSTIFYSKDYGASWFVLTAAGSRAWSSVAISENGSTISATTNDSTGGVWVYAMPDEQYYRSPALTNSGSTTTPSTVRAITYGNSGTGAATDGYWVAGADASANTLAYSSNGIDWTAVVGSKTTLFNSVNGVAYGADVSGTSLWVAVGSPFIGSVPGTTAFSIAYSYNMTTWVGVRNAANFTGQGNHVFYGQDEFGAGMWVAVGQSDGVLAANLGDSSLYNSNGTPNTTIFYSYDGANWAAGTGPGIFAVSGTDVSWGVDASGVGMWVATGIGFTDPTTGAVIAGGQVAHSVNGRGWSPIRAPTSIVPAMTPATIPANERRNVIPAPPTSTGFAASLYTDIWRMLGGDIDGEAASDNSGRSVALSADGTTVAIGAPSANANDSGHVRVYKYNPNKTTTPVGWEQLGADIDGEAQYDESGTSVALSADGTTLAIGARYANTPTGTNDVGHVRVYKYNPNKTTTPAGWDRLGEDIDGEAQDDQSGTSVALSADGTTLAIGAPLANTPAGTNNVGHVRVYKYNPNKTPAAGWDQMGADIDGEAQDDVSGYSVALSADGTTLAIGARGNDGTTINSNVGHVRVYKYPNTTTTSASWTQLGADIDGEATGDQSGWSVALSADGTTLAIGAIYANTPAGTNDVGHVRVYKYNPNKTVAQTNQSLAGFGPAGWDRLGEDIDGEAQDDQSGYSVALSADGTTLAIGAHYANTPAGTNNVGHVRVYKYNPNKTTTPAGWDQLGVDIDGEAADDLSGYSVALSADGTTLAIGARANDGPTVNSNVGHVRVYKLITAQVPATFTISNPAIADIENGGFIVIKSAGSATITAVQPAAPPFTFAPVIVQGTLTVSGSVYTLVYDTFYPIFTPFPGAVAGNTITVAYGRAGSQGAGAPLWIVGGAGSSNVFARSSLPGATTTTSSAWSVVASTAPTANAPFPVCNSIGYSNGVWVAGNNTAAANVFARSTDGGITWTPVTASSVAGIITGAAAVGTNAFCNYSLAVADYSNDTNLRSWIAVQGTKNFFFEGGVSTVATVTPNIVATAYNSSGGNTRAWWVAGGVGLSDVAALGYTVDPSGATGWTKSASSQIANLATVNAIAFSPFTERWLAVGAGATGSSGTNILISDASGATWTSSAVATELTPLITLNTCIWNEAPASASSAGRWIAAGTRNGDVGANAASLYISTDASGGTTPWTPVAGTGAILSQVYSLAFNGHVWIAAGMPATDNGSTSTLMRTTDPTGAAGWQGIPLTNASASGFDTSTRSITWNADQQMWIATGENTGSVADASFSSVIYSLDISGSTGTWRAVCESNSTCFAGQGNGIAFTGRKWFAVGEGTNQIVATADSSANTSFGTGALPTWSASILSVGNANTAFPVRGTDITFTGSTLVATGVGNGGSGVAISTSPTGLSWSNTTVAGFTDASGGGTSITFDPTFDGTGCLIATGKSATNSITVSTDGGATWNTSTTTVPTTVQFSSRQQTVLTTQSLFTTGGNSVAYVGNDTLFGRGGHDVHWTGKRWIATGGNSGDTTSSETLTVTDFTATVPDITNNNTTPVACSDDGITWQCVSSGQSPNITEGMFVASNSRIGATPLIDSRIAIMDGGDTETMWSDSITLDSGGSSGTGIAQIDIIAELPVTSVSASNTTGTVSIIGVGANNPINGIGVTPTASFDNVAFIITTHPIV